MKEGRGIATRPVPAARVQSLRDRKLQLRQGWFFHFPNNDQVEIRRSQLRDADFKLRDRSASGWLKMAFSALDGRHTVAEALSRVPQGDRQAIENVFCMLQRSFLYEASSAPDASMPAWYEHLLGERGTARDLYVDTLRRARITIVGTGLLASRLAAHLSELELAKLTILDHLPSHPPWESHQHAAARAFKSIQRSVRAANSQRIGSGVLNVVQTNDEAVEHIRANESDLLILALDCYDPDLAVRVNAACIETSRRWLFCLVDGWDLYAGPCFVPGKSGCLRCMLDAAYAGAITASAFTGGLCAQALMNPAFADLLAGIIIADVPNLLGQVPYRLERGASLLLGSQLTLRLRDYDAARWRVLRRPDCTACGGRT